MSSSTPKAAPWQAVSFFAPVYYDAGTVGQVVEKAVALFEEKCPDYEIWLINDASPDNAGEVIQGLMARFPKVHTLTHDTNKGYGITIRDGLSHASQFPWVAFCDGDDQFDIRDLDRLVPELEAGAAAVITRRETFPNGPLRTYLSRRYNRSIRKSFNVPYEDISCSLKLFRRSALEGLHFGSESPFIDAEIVLRIAHQGGVVKEVGIPSYPRTSGRSTSLRPRNVLQVMREIKALRRELRP